MQLRQYWSKNIKAGYPAFLDRKTMCISAFSPSYKVTKQLLIKCWNFFIGDFKQCFKMTYRVTFNLPDNTCHFSFRKTARCARAVLTKRTYLLFLRQGSNGRSHSAGGCWAFSPCYAKQGKIYNTLHRMKSGSCVMRQKAGMSLHATKQLSSCFFLLVCGPATLQA